MRNCLIFRTNFYSKEWHDFLLLYNNFIKVVIVADLRDEEYIYTGVEQVSFSRENVLELGLSYDDEVQWRCGDYAYYLAYHNYKFDFAWMIEPDCFFNGVDLKKLFLLEANFDFISTFVTKAKDDWYWKSISKYSHETYRCFFPITRLSKSAVIHLFSKRKSTDSSMNDESFVISEVFNKGLSFAELNEAIPSIKYSIKNYSYRNVHYSNYLRLKIYLGLSKDSIYHPVYFSIYSYLRSFFKKKTWKIMLGINSND